MRALRREGNCGIISCSFKGVRMDRFQYPQLDKPPPPPAFLPILIGDARRRIYAGPYRQKPAGMYGIKLAAEIDAPADFDLPIRDFDVPKDALRLTTALAIALDRLARGLPTYVGCYGG